MPPEPVISRMSTFIIRSSTLPLLSGPDILFEIVLIVEEPLAHRPWHNRERRVRRLCLHEVDPLFGRATVIDLDQDLRIIADVPVARLRHGCDEIHDRADVVDGAGRCAQYDKTHPA